LGLPAGQELYTSIAILPHELPAELIFV